MRSRGSFGEARLAVRRQLGLAPDPRRPSRALFSGIRRRLTLWYSAVIAGALILSGTVLYFEVQSNLLGPMNTDLQGLAAPAILSWQHWSVDQQGMLAYGPCTPVVFAVRQNDPNAQVACYDKRGIQIGGTSEDPQLAPFNNSGLAASVTSGGSGGDTVTTSYQGEFASIQRYAVAVPDPNNSRRYIGVVQIGLPVGGQGAALSTLLDLLLLLGILTILFSLGAGLFLASRALQPARIAYARQRDFIADASHELRTPLTMLRSSVEFVLRGRDHLPPDDVALLEDTVLETTHLTQLANNMLDLARLDSENVHIEEEVVDLSEVAEEVGRWAQSLARERGVRVSVTAEAPVLILGDGSLLQQAVLVLVDNAIKYNQPDGRVDIRVTQTGGEGMLTVRDTGIGVGSDHLKRLGERFYRVDKARSRESGGAGLGLSIVRSVIARHNGSFEIASEPGAGTAVTVRLGVIGRDRVPMFEEQVGMKGHDDVGVDSRSTDGSPAMEVDAEEEAAAR